MRIERKIKEKEKKKEEVGREGRTPTHQTKSNSVWGGSPPPLGSADSLGVLGPQGKSPPPPPIYSGVLGLI